MEALFFFIYQTLIRCINNTFPIRGHLLKTFICTLLPMQNSRIAKQKTQQNRISNANLLNIRFISFHWRPYQYRNKIPLKQENTAMMYQLETGVQL